MSEQDEILKECAKLKYPLIVKPATLGSSVGINFAKDEEELKNAIEEHIKPKGIIINECYCMTGTNIGPGLYAAYYIGKELSENLVEEQKIMNTILGK